MKMQRLLFRKRGTLWLLTGLMGAALCLALGARAFFRELPAAQPSPAPAPAPTLTPAPGPRIVVDAGHGGGDGGSVGQAGTVEAGLNLAVAKLLEEELTAAGYRVRMTRRDENALGETKKADMAARGRALADPEAALCVSVHMNAFTDTAVRGPMAFYMEGSAEGKALADAVIAAVCEAVGTGGRSANPGDYFVLRQSLCPAVLVECGFLSNAAEEKLLCDPDYQRKLAAGIAAGIAAYLDAGAAAP